MEVEELVFRINDITIRVKEDFVRIDTSSGMEADDYCLDFSNAEEVRKLCLLEEKDEKQRK